MAFKVLGRVTEANLKVVAISAITVSVGDLLEKVSGATTWTLCTATSKWYSRKAIAMEAATTASTTVLVDELNGSELVSALVANTANATHNGDQIVLSNAYTVNNTGTNSTDDAVAFMQDGVVDTTHISGRVLVGNGEITTAT
jgi:hypothetical protein